MLDTNPKSYARTAGVLYLIIAVFGAFSIGYVPSVILNAGDAAQTASNLLGNQRLFAAGIFADVVVLIAEIALTVMLYELLKPVGRTASMIAAAARFAMVLVMAINILINITPLFVLTNPALTEVFSTDQLNALALGFFEAHGMAVYIWGILFGVHVFVLGQLVCNSGYFPKALGGMMVIGSFGYSLQGVTKIMGVEGAALSISLIGLLTLVTIAELGFAFWLLIKGLDVEKWNAQAR